MLVEARAKILFLHPKRKIHRYPLQLQGMELGTAICALRIDIVSSISYHYWKKSIKGAVLDP
jgi:hypothetical protein